MPPPAGHVVNYSPSSARAWAAGWDYASARSAVDEHLRGRFVVSYQLGIDLNRHPAVIAARRQRRSAITALPWILRGPERAPGRFELEAAAGVWSQVLALLGEVVDDLAVHGFAVLQHPVTWDDTESGPRAVIRSVSQYPIACVEHGSAIGSDAPAGPYDPDRYYARAAGGARYLLPLPGQTDLHWTVIGEGAAPHRRGAIIACDLEYVSAQLKRRAWAKLINMLGRASVVGGLPVEIPIRLSDGSENPIAADFQEMLEALGETQIAGIKPPGSTVDEVQVTATTADLLPQSIDDSARMFALAILGHDAGVTRGSSVYTDPRAQSVPQDLARDDERLIRGAVSSLLTALARLNVERCGPVTVDGQIPDSDQDIRRAEVQARRASDDAHRAALLAAAAQAAAQVETERRAGLIVDDARIAYLYSLAGAEAPRLPPVPGPVPAGPPPAPPEAAAAA